MFLTFYSCGGQRMTEADGFKRRLMAFRVDACRGTDLPGNSPGDHPVRTQLWGFMDVGETRLPPQHSHQCLL